MSRVNLKKGKVGPNSLGGYEKCSAIVGHFGTVTGSAGTLEEGTPLLLNNINEAEGYGLKNNPLLYHHVSEYFRMGGRGATLRILSVAGAATFADMIASDDVKQLIVDADGVIFNLGFAYIPSEEPSYVDGLHSEMLPAIKAAQVFADWARETNRPLHTVLECAMLNGTSSSVLNLRDIKDNGVLVECPQVSLVVGQDWDFAEKLTGNEQKYAAVGAVLGCMAAQPVSFNIGEVETMGLTNATRNVWISAGLSNHETVKSLEAQLDGFNTKGYIFGEYYSGIVVLNDDHVCTPEIVDDEGNMNEHSIALSRTNAKVFREIYRVYLPKVKSTVPVDAATGKLGTGMIKYFEGFGDRVLGNMEMRQEISGGKTTVDPESDLLSGDKALKVFYNWVPMGTIGRIEGTINIKRSI